MFLRQIGYTHRNVAVCYYEAKLLAPNTLTSNMTHKMASVNGLTTDLIRASETRKELKYDEVSFVDWSIDTFKHYIPESVKEISIEMLDLVIDKPIQTSAMLFFAVGATYLSQGWSCSPD
ncbi:hypothetical protein [Piscirickettsia litoralis]|uniref:Uncharacterized protein n=1 Tax=Piscirickettsia litoralis TaxID=1891921 RepID=A0ABX3A0L2_9GAMM|nr:hypothetical protein [Piscirickettsia litoralis]ODN41988.1 hypothetical protein BGC07_02210 [Piscirickettsia litoralis]